MDWVVLKNRAIFLPATKTKKEAQQKSTSSEITYPIHTKQLRCWHQSLNKRELTTFDKRIFKKVIFYHNWRFKGIKIQCQHSIVILDPYSNQNAWGQKTRIEAIHCCGSNYTVRILKSFQINKLIFWISQCNDIW